MINKKVIFGILKGLFPRTLRLRSYILIVETAIVYQSSSRIQFSGKSLIKSQEVTCHGLWIGSLLIKSFYQYIEPKSRLFRFFVDSYDTIYFSNWSARYFQEITPFDLKIEILSLEKITQLYPIFVSPLLLVYSFIVKVQQYTKVMVLLQKSLLPIQ